MHKSARVAQVLKRNKGPKKRNMRPRERNMRLKEEEISISFTLYLFPFPSPPNFLSFSWFLKNLVSKRNSTLKPTVLKMNLCL